MGEHKHSRQREIIRRLISDRTDHPTADQLYEEAKEIYPGISIGTVYRNLAFLAKTGAIQRIPHPGGADRYDGRTEPHHHFICTCCGSLQDINVLFDSAADPLREIGLSFKGGRISGFSVVYTGLCNNCLAAGELPQETLPYLSHQRIEPA